ncbi:MAG TPA: amidohydrolase, partial [Bryobacteraceae bacterium]|nr:amidohydrolase [Bryobacteraceae bacterium]
MLLILAFFTLFSMGSVAAQPADLIIRNAVVYTVNKSQPIAGAIAVRGDRIVAVDNVESLVGPKTQVLDVAGATVLPGLIDSHVHMAGLGALLLSFDLRHDKSPESIASKIKQAALSQPKGEWIQGRAWDDTNWGGKLPDASILDKAAPDHPVMLRRVDGHASWVNTKAIEIAGINDKTPDPPGGKIIRDNSGKATGILIDRAQGLVGSKIPPPTEEQIRQVLKRAAQECARLGLTTVHDAGIGPAEIAAYKKLIASGELPVRVYAMIGGSGELWKSYLARGPEIGDRLTVRSIKLVADGAMGSRGAAFWQPYSDAPGNTGLLILSQADIERVARDAVAKGFQVNTHAIGDRANRTVLDAYGAVLGNKNDKRFRIEHAQVVSLPDFALFAKYDVIASIQSTHATSDMRWAEARLGPDRLMGAWAPRRFLNSGVKITNGSDTPVENPNPLWGFYAAVTRQDHQGNPPGGFLPSEKLTRDEALHSWTLAGAYAAFEEKDKGSIETGKLADFIVLNRDVMKVPE